MTRQWRHWILVGREPRLVELEVWARWFGSADRHVRKTRIWGTDVWVSTVFLGIDHRFVGEEGDPPFLFETMVFDGSFSDLYCERYSSWGEAEDGHDYAVVWVLYYLLKKGVRHGFRHLFPGKEGRKVGESRDRESNS